jgi:hypothetical protein
MDRMKGLCLALGLGALVASACASTRGSAPPVGQTQTTSGSAEPMCIHRGLSCLHNQDCCSGWCVSGACARYEP